MLPTPTHVGRPLGRRCRSSKVVGVLNELEDPLNRGVYHHRGVDLGRERLLDRAPRLRSFGVQPQAAYPGPRTPWIATWIWASSAVFTWSISVLGSIATASDIAALPQPNQQFWIAFVRYSELLPVAVAVIAGTVLWAARRKWWAVVRAASHGLLWPSIGLIFLWVPKAP